MSASGLTVSSGVTVQRSILDAPLRGGPFPGVVGQDRAVGGQGEGAFGRLERPAYILIAHHRRGAEGRHADAVAAAPRLDEGGGGDADAADAALRRLDEGDD